ncbi:tetratricopeptide repeat protein [Mucilaginibacter agri]|uniref:Tetratricopeptide repeat protein n=1 Tax=Mucilaginibacter agri TaxID=2695265 RepID=A0A965ZE48_9SPHI|nr:tetratricopeptide repeat protein [Mucilaginibacter agri]NCD68101.1 tetratricopeptide repeat protein [Mucilaginibacter agri]
MSTFYNYFTEQVKRNGLTIFCGAGISLDSGFPLANQLVEKLFFEVGITPEENSTFLKAKLPFESIAAVFAELSGSLEFLSIYKKGIPNFNHYLIAELASQGYIKTIVTTNFDTLIEQAFEKCGLNDKDVQVYADEQQFHKINWSNGKITLVKIHGTINQKRKMAVTLKKVANAQLSNGRKAVIDHLTSLKQPVLFLGYSFSDKFDISVHLRLAEKKMADVYTVWHNTKRAAPRVMNIHLRTSYPFAGFNRAMQISVDTGIFMREIADRLLSDRILSPAITRFHWEKPVESWFENQRSKHPEMCDAVAARLLYLTGCFPLSEERSQAALKKSVSISKRFDQLRNLGIVWKELGDYDRALEYLTQAHDLSKTLSDKKMRASVLNNISYTYGSKKAYDQAETYVKQALKLAGKIRNKELLAIAYNNQGILLGATTRYKAALTSFKRSLQLIDRVGLIQWKPRTINNQGIATRLLGDPAKALTMHQDALTLAESLGFNDEILLARENMGRAYLALSDFRNAINETKKACRIAKKSSKQDSYRKCLRLMSEIHARQGNHTKSRYYRRRAAFRKA